MKKIIDAFFIGLILVILTVSTMAATPTEAEKYDAKCWIGAKLAGETGLPGPDAFIEVVANNDPVFADARQGKPLCIGGKQYNKGLYCHANSRLMITLPEPARSFTAQVGIDSNDNTKSGRGSVRFQVKAGDRELWQSPLLIEGLAPVKVDIPLDGAKTFELLIDDGGDDISHDQADWAEARVTLESGRTLYLSDLPIIEPNPTVWSTEPFISFDYDGKNSREFLSTWQFNRSQEIQDDTKTAYTLSWTDPKTQLEAVVKAVEYNDYPTVEWTLYFTNHSSSETPIISNIKVIDTAFRKLGSKEFTLNYNRGDECTAESFEPFQEELKPGTTKHIANTGGRPTQTAFPYYNLECGDAQGLIFVVSWAGQWSCDFVRDSGDGVTLQAGQELTHFKLLPGETVRQPMIVLQFWRGNTTNAQNVWRSWMLDHNVPRDAQGELPPQTLHVACSSHWYNEMINADTKSQIFFIDQYLAKKMKLDYWWMDAGWYIVKNTNNWPETGTWEIDENRFPGGFAPISDHAHSKEVKIIVWFEPERVAPGTWLADERTGWVLGGKNGGLLNLGNPEVCQWLIDHVDEILTKNKIDLYRQDFNMDPLDYWRHLDAPDRQGIAEIRHVEAYFRYWDALQSRHPGMLIDSCASGGRRNDLETLRRAVPLLRSDYIMEPVGNQAHSWALAAWFPFSGTGTSRTDTYDIHSTLCPSFNSCWDMRNEQLDFDRLKTIIDQWREYGKYYFGDFYPLTSHSLDPEKWIAWQFNEPKLDGGFFQVFRRDQSPYQSASFRLKGLCEESDYLVWNVDTPEKQSVLSGKELMEKGFPVIMNVRPDSAVFVYRESK